MSDYKIIFPNPELADEDGLLAIGGNLVPETLITAYSQGIFPWTVNPITWWSPNPRAIFDITNFKLSSRMQRYNKQLSLSFTLDKAFEEVMKNCAKPAPSRESTWISKQFIKAYCNMHELGFAHSCEAWQNDELVAGVYGVSIGGFFAGESMFYKVSNSSTLCLNYLITHLKKQGFLLFDSQVINPHTRQLGAIEISRNDYLTRLTQAVKLDCKF